MVEVEEIRRKLPSSSWLGVGLLGLAVFVLGIYVPALRRFPSSNVVEVVVAIAGGVVTVLGFTFWWDQRADEIAHPVRRPLKGRAREVASIAPSFEVYKPAQVVRSLPPPAEPDEEPRP